MGDKTIDLKCHVEPLKDKFGTKVSFEVIFHNSSVNETVKFIEETVSPIFEKNGVNIKCQQKDLVV